MRSRDGDARALEARAGIGLRAPHVAEILSQRRPIAWLEVHPENYMGDGPALRDLERVRENYAISLHGVGLSLGTAGPLDARHLERLAALVERIAPVLVSEHLSWSVADGAYLNHLLPLPLTEEALEVVASHVDQVQARLRRRILVENPSSYLRFTDSTIPEAVFLAELTRRTGCGVLCDVNNLYVSSRNVGFDPIRYLEALPPAVVNEIHLAGHAINDADGHEILIDDHGGPVANAVWRLYALALERFGTVPTLIEWDTNLPPLDVLLAEAAEAQALMSRIAGGAHVCAA
jgi:uncharacterized protein (UPF0276 family)